MATTTSMHQLLSLCSGAGVTQTVKMDWHSRVLFFPQAGIFFSINMTTLALKPLPPHPAFLSTCSTDIIFHVFIVIVDKFLHHFVGMCSMFQRNVLPSAEG